MSSEIKRYIVSNYLINSLVGEGQSRILCNDKFVAGRPQLSKGELRVSTRRPCRRQDSFALHIDGKRHYKTPRII